MTSYGPKHAARSLNPEQVRAAADRADGTVPEPAASPTGDKGGVYSITALAEMAGFHRDTISDWTRRKENPLPTVSGGSHGVEYRISLRCLIEWREDQARVEGAFQFMGIKAPYKAIMARDKFVRMGESERALVYRAPMQAAIRTAPPPWSPWRRPACSGDRTSSPSTATATASGPRRTGPPEACAGTCRRRPDGRSPLVLFEVPGPLDVVDVAVRAGQEVGHAFHDLLQSQEIHALDVAV